MKPNARTQTDTTLKFDGAEAAAPGKIRTSLMTNHHTGYMNDGREVNFGRGPVGGGSTPSTRISNPDKINCGAQVRTPGGTRSWEPSAGQNYQGNPDQIRAQQSGGPGYGTTTKSTRPVKNPTNPDGFNFGPKSQY